MKTKTLLFTAFMMLSSFSLFAQDGSEMVTVRLSEVYAGNMVPSQIHIYYSDGNFEVIELEKVKAKSYPKDNLAKITTVFTRLYDANYEVVSTVQSGLGGSTLWIFKKKD
jgi:hypothetical protein